MSETVYIPGLGTGRLYEAQIKFVRALNALNILNVLNMPRWDRHFSFFDAKWETGEPLDEKNGRLHELMKSTGATIVDAISAGGALAIPLTLEFPDIATTNLICAKANGAETIQEKYRKRAPEFYPAAVISDQALESIDPRKFVCFAPTSENDGAIKRVSMLIDDAPVVDLPPLPHLLAITYALARHVAFQ